MIRDVSDVSDVRGRVPARGFPGLWPLITITGSIYTVDLVDIASVAYTAEQQQSSVETPNTPSGGRRIKVFRA